MSDRDVTEILPEHVCRMNLLFRIVAFNTPNYSVMRSTKARRLFVASNLNPINSLPLHDASTSAFAMSALSLTW